MGNDYHIFKKILLVFTTINNPYTVLFDKLGLKNNFLHRTYTGTKFITRVKSTDINEGVAILSGKEYPMKILNISSKKQPIVIDAGAHIGFFSLYIKSLNPRAKVYAIEPLEENIRYIKKNLDLNKIKGVTILKFALSDKQGKDKLWLSGNNFDVPTISLPIKKRLNDYRMIETHTLAGVIKSNHLNKVDVLKMDIEGVELKVLKKEINLIMRCVDRLLVEYHSDRDSRMRKKIITLMTKNNFRFIFENRHVLGFLNEKLIK